MFSKKYNKVTTMCTTVSTTMGTIMCTKNGYNNEYMVYKKNVCNNNMYTQQKCVQKCVQTVCIDMFLQKMYMCTSKKLCTQT